MTLVMAQVNLDHDGAADIAWSAVLEQFEAGMAERCWLATVRPGGRPPWDPWVLTPGPPSPWAPPAPCRGASVERQAGCPGSSGGLPR